MQRTSDVWLQFPSFPSSKYVFLPCPHITNWNKLKYLRASSSPGNVRTATFLHTTNTYKRNACVNYALFYYFYYLLILVASCQTYFVTTLIHYVVASKKIPYFSNSTCMHSRKQSKMLSELREEEKDAEQGAVLSPNRGPGSKDEFMDVTSLYIFHSCVQ